MSDTPANPPSPAAAPTAAPRPFFKPWTLLLGFVASLALLAFAGRTVIKQDLHPTAVRFHPMIAPDSQYEPTMGEMRAFVRARSRLQMPRRGIDAEHALGARCRRLGLPAQ